MGQAGSGEGARAISNCGVKEPFYVQNPVGFFGVENFLAVCLNHRMAKYGMRQNVICGKCGGAAEATIETIERELSYSDYGTSYAPPTQIVTVQCGCTYRGNPAAPFNPKAKETPVTQKFDTTPEKNTALTAIEKSVRKLEVALYNRTEALAKTQIEHSKHITEASNALDRVLAESLQVGIDSDDYDLYLNDYTEELSERLSGILEIMSLANVKAVI